MTKKKVVALANFRSKETEFERMEQYNLGIAGLVLDPMTQIEQLKLKALEHLYDPDGLAIEVASLLSHFSFLQNGLFPPAGMSTTISVRRHKETGRLSLYVVYVTISEFTRVQNNHLPWADAEPYMKLNIDFTESKADDYDVAMGFSGVSPILISEPFEVYNTRMATAMFERISWMSYAHRGKLFRSGRVYFASLPHAPKMDTRIALECVQFQP